MGWLKIEAQGCTEGPTAVHIRSTRKGVKPNPSFLSMGKGGFRVNLMNWGVSMTKAEMCELQELMEAFGAEKGVRFKSWEGEQ